jgi:hypothetical protein
VIGGRPGSAPDGRRRACRELRPGAAQLIQTRDHLVADRRVVRQVDALQAKDDVRVDAVQIARDLAAARVIQAALQALDDGGRLVYRKTAVMDAPRLDRAPRLPDPSDRAFVQQNDLLRRRERRARLAIGIDRPAQGLYGRPLLPAARRRAGPCRSPGCLL